MKKIKTKFQILHPGYMYIITNVVVAKEKHVFKSVAMVTYTVYEIVTMETNT